MTDSTTIHFNFLMDMANHNVNRLKKLAEDMSQDDYNISEKAWEETYAIAKDIDHNSDFIKLLVCSYSGVFDQEILSDKYMDPYYSTIIPEFFQAIITIENICLWHFKKINDKPELPWKKQCTSDKQAT